MDLTDAGALSALTRLVQEILKAEAPMHIEVLNSRVRDAWQKGRSGKVIQDQIAIAVAALKRKKSVATDGPFVDLANRTTLLSRRPGAEQPRKAKHVPTAERHVALTGLVAEVPGISTEELVREAARFFGWGRVGSDIRAALVHDVRDLITSGAIAESAAGLIASVPRAPHQLNDHG
jgi:hypothetical protein